MSPPTSTLVLHRTAIVARLRAAGCVFAEDEADLLISSAGTDAELLTMVDRRVDGHPLEHILGWAQFCGIRIALTPGVFIPRARTEFLASTAAALVGRPAAVVVDLCCGSGAVGAAIAAKHPPPASLYAVDIDPVSVVCARRNLEPLGARVYQGDLFGPLPDELRGGVDVLVANAPYVPTDAIDLLPREARLHEPRLALDGGHDGLDLLRRIAAEAPGWLAPGGRLLVEMSRNQSSSAARIMNQAGLAGSVVHDDDLDATVVIGRRLR